VFVRIHELKGGENLKILPRASVMVSGECLNCALPLTRPLRVDWADHALKSYRPAPDIPLDADRGGRPQIDVVALSSGRVLMELTCEGTCRALRDFGS